MSVPLIHIANSHRWLYDSLTGPAEEQTDFGVVGDRAESDLLIYLDAPWPDPAAPDQLRSLTLRDIRRLYLFSQNDDPFAWAPGVFASLPRSHARGAAFAGGFFVAHHHHQPGGLGEHLVPVSLDACDLLWSFVGTVENAPIRERVLEFEDERGLAIDTKRWSDIVRWGWQREHHEEGQKNFRAYAQTLSRSKFIVCPRGRGPSSIRLFEALQVARCPVIVSDEWLPPPFVDWVRCSIQVPEEAIEHLPAILREREAEAEALGRAARLVWEQHFAPARLLNTLVRSCLEIHRVTPARSRIGIAARALVKPHVLRRAARRVLHR